MNVVHSGLCPLVGFLCKEGLTKRSLINTYYFSLKVCFESSLAFSSHP